MSKRSNNRLRSMMAAQGGRCYFCHNIFRPSGPQRATCDHLDPLCFHVNGLSRKAAVCFACNQSKGPLDEHTFARLRGDQKALRRARKRAQNLAHLYAGNFRLIDLPEMIARALEDDDGT